jgi:hypothetical protein
MASCSTIFSKLLSIPTPEAALSTSESWYKTAGSFCGAELLNNELNQGASPAGTAGGSLTGNQVVAYSGAWGDIAGNVAGNLNTRYTNTGTVWNPYGGQQRTLPLGLVSGIGRMRNLLPLNVLGEIQLTFFAGNNNEMLLNSGGGTDSYYSLRGVYARIRYMCASSCL